MYRKQGLICAKRNHFEYNSRELQEVLPRVIAHAVSSQGFRQIRNSVIENNFTEIQKEKYNQCQLVTNQLYKD